VAPGAAFMNQIKGSTLQRQNVTGMTNSEDAKKQLCVVLLVKSLDFPLMNALGFVDRSLESPVMEALSVIDCFYYCCCFCVV